MQIKIRDLVSSQSFLVSTTLQYIRFFLKKKKRKWLESLVVCCRLQGSVLFLFLFSFLIYEFTRFVRVVGMCVRVCLEVCKHFAILHFSVET